MTRTHRNRAFDNLRTLMVLFTVLLHACCAYAMGTPWWHAQDAKSPVFDITIVTIDAFALPVLFFVAGLFAHPCLDRHGTAGFINNKLKRLGIPLVAITLFNLPAMVYVGYLRRAPEPVGFLEYWLKWMTSFKDWSFANITNLEQGAKYADAMSPHHLWFISLLLIFFLGYAVARKTFPAIEIGMGKLTVIAALTICIGFTALNLAVQDWAWARFGPFILFQPTRIAVYLGMFVFGILARTHMDKFRPFPGSWWCWLIIFLAGQATLIAMVQQLMAPGPAPLHMAVIHGALRAVLAVSATAFIVNLFTSRLPTPSRWRESLAASSYDIYLWHMPLVVFIQAALYGHPIPLGLKMLAAFIIPALTFWALSRTAARISPTIWAGYACAIFLGFSFATG